MKDVHKNVRNCSDLDYVTAWYRIAAEYMQNNPSIKTAFVSTNSITQGEQVSILWPHLLECMHLVIIFAYRTFRWKSDARGAAHVHVVIIGFSIVESGEKRIFEYRDKDEKLLTECKVSHISPYLTEHKGPVIRKSTKPLCGQPTMRCGNKPSDGGNLILQRDERDELIKDFPESAQLIRQYLGSEELIQGGMRWCLWLNNAPPNKYRHIKPILDRIARVQTFRASSSAEPTRESARTPHMYFFISQPENDYIAVPEVSSETRDYIPVVYLPSEVIASNKLYVVGEPSRFVLGVIQSSMHMAWMRAVAGRLESRYQYSASLVYNTFPWPISASTAKESRVVELSTRLLNVRHSFVDKGATLADLYDPLTMPAPLLKAHQALDRAVDRCYRAAPFNSERERVEYLFQLYEQLTAPLASAETRKRRRSKD